MLSGKRGNNQLSHSELCEGDKYAVESYANEMREHLEDADATKARCQIVDYSELPELAWPVMT